MRFKVPLISFLFIHTLVGFGQEAGYIYGKIIDANSKVEIPFANIKVKNKTIGLISNDDGSFKIPTYFEKVADTLVISFIGHYSKEILVSTLDKKKINIIELIEKIENLDEVVIYTSKKKLRAKQIVKSAIKNIPENYPFSPFSYIGYYRDYQKTEDKYLNLNEALLQVFDAGFDQVDFKNTETRVFEYKKNLDFPRDSVASKPYDYANRTKVIDNATIGGTGGNEFSILRLHDAIRNFNVNTYDFVNNLKKDFVKNHRFKLVKEAYLGDIPLYDLSFKKNEKQFEVRGEIFIGKGDFKIYKLEYAVYEKKVEKEYNPDNIIPVTTKIVKGKEKLLFKITTEYQNVNDLMYPNYISFYNAFDLLKPPKFVPTGAIINFDKQRFEIVFNNVIEPSQNLNKKDFKLSYQELEIAIDSLNFKKDKVYLYPFNPKDIFSRSRIEERKRQSSKGIVLQVINIQDIDGNIVYEQEATNYNQFREFFVQELKLDDIKPKDSIFMIKNQPLSEKQPILPPKDITKYWMNTPLKN